jgi:hypothetical protein
MTEDKLYEELKNKDEFKRIFIRAVQGGQRLKNCGDKGYISLNALSEKIKDEWRNPI